MATKPLAGYRVLDVTNVLSGPFCCHQLAHMGAEVIKVEVPGTGDLARQLGADPKRNAELMGVSYLAQNAGKRSVTLNLKSEGGKRVFEALVRDADALVENFRPGVMERLGVGYEALRAVNPQLVYCAISGFGQDGPMAHLPAYDQIIQGMSGVMSITGDAQTAPYRVGYPMADTIGGMTAAFAVAAALANRSEERGAYLDVSMLEAVIATMGWVVSNHLIAGHAPEPRGNDNFTASPSGAFRTADGVMNLAANKQQQFEAVCEVIGRLDLVEDPRFAARLARLENRADLSAELETAFVTDVTASWVTRLNGAGVPAGPVMSVPDILAHPQIAARGLVQDYGGTSVLGSAVKVDGVAPRVDGPPPELGADTDAVLSEAGFSEDDIAALRAEGAI